MDAEFERRLAEIDRLLEVLRASVREGQEQAARLAGRTGAVEKRVDGLDDALRHVTAELRRFGRLVGDMALVQARMAERMEGGFERLDSRLDAGFAEVSRRFGEVDRRFAAMDERFAAMDVRFSAMDERFVAELHRHAAEVNERVAEMSARLTTMTHLLIESRTADLERLTGIQLELARLRGES
jgi:hypothetical protein